MSLWRPGHINAVEIIRRGLLPLALGLSIVSCGVAQDSKAATDSSESNSPLSSVEKGSAGSHGSNPSDPGSISQSGDDSVLGSADEQLAVGVGSTVQFDQAANFGNEVSASVTAVADVEVEAILPGERNGPGLAFTLQITNESSVPVALGAVIVDLVEPDGGSATQISSAQEDSLGGELAPGSSMAATYVFQTSEDSGPTGSDLKLVVNYSSAPSAAVFSGNMK